MLRLLIFAVLPVCLTVGCQAPFQHGTYCQPRTGLFHGRPFGQHPPWRLFSHRSNECSPCKPSRALLFASRVPGLERVLVWEMSQRCAFKSLRALRKTCGQRTTPSFRSGFRHAYSDILQGRPGVVPAVPPKKYWGAYYRTPDGREKAHEWLEGYRVGVEYARAEGLDRFGEVATNIGGACDNGPPMIPDQPVIWSPASGPVMGPGTPQHPGMTGYSGCNGWCAPPSQPNAYQTNPPSSYQWPGHSVPSGTGGPSAQPYQSPNGGIVY